MFILIFIVSFLSVIGIFYVLDSIAFEGVLIAIVFCLGISVFGVDVLVTRYDATHEGTIERKIYKETNVIGKPGFAFGDIPTDIYVTEDFESKKVQISAVEKGNEEYYYLVKETITKECPSPKRTIIHEKYIWMLAQDRASYGPSFK